MVAWSPPAFSSTRHASRQCPALFRRFSSGTTSRLPLIMVESQTHFGFGMTVEVVFTSNQNVRTTRPTDPLYEKIRVGGLRSAMTPIIRCRPVRWLVVSFEVQCVSRTHH
jgi:hypothetical protein